MFSFMWLEKTKNKNQVCIASRFSCYDKGVVFLRSAAFRQKIRCWLTLFIRKSLQVLKNHFHFLLNVFFTIVLRVMIISNNNIVINNDRL